MKTGHGGFIDLLAVDEEGNTHVLELKRDKTPRDVVAQTIDYGSWVAGLSHAEVVEIFENYRNDMAFDEAFAEFFGTTAPDELNAGQVFTIVAATVDAATERIVRFLNESYDIPLNVVFFRHFDDNGVSYLARSWLVTQESGPQPRTAANTGRTREPWNGRDWYVSFGEDSKVRVWEDGREYGFVSAGGGEWYTRSLKNLPEGARIFTHIPKTGYVGVGTVCGPATRFSDVVVTVDAAERRLADLPLRGSYQHSPDGDTVETAEYVVPVRWHATVPASEAIWKTGMFANQNSACKLRKQFTIDIVSQALDLLEDV